MSASGNSFFSELQRRHVYKVGAMYCVAGWLLIQIATQVFPFFDISSAAVRWVVIAVIAGFPFALVLAWLFDITPQGIVRTESLTASVEAPAIAVQRRDLDRRLNYLLGGLLLIAIGYVAVEHTLLRGAARPSDGMQPASTGDKSIAVLPFENLSDDKANAYFAEGIQDEILTRLAGVADLKVISRTSTEKYKSQPENLKTVAAELGVGSILEGSVQKAGDAVRVNVQLIDARTDKHLWAQTYDRELKNVFAVESEVSQSIADALKAKLSPIEATALAKAATGNAAAYDLFLKAEYELHKATDSNQQADFLKAENHYRQALLLDPGFALAQAELAYCMLSRHWFTTPLTANEMADVKAEIDHALAVAPGLAEAHEAAGYYRYWGFRDYESAKVEFRRVLELEPNNAQAIASLGFVQRRQGEWAKAAATLARAISYAPRDSTMIDNYGQTYIVMRRYEDADRALRQALAIDPDDIQTRTFLTINQLMRDGDVPAALVVFADLPQERRAPGANSDGDVMNVVNARVYPYVFARRFDEAMQAWPTPNSETDAQRIERLSARVAIQTLAGHRASMQAECGELRGLLEAQRDREQEAFALTAALSWTYLCLGRNNDAISTSRRASESMTLAKDAWNGSYMLTGLAEIDAQTGHADEALKLIAQLLSIPAGDSISTARLRLDPVWDPLRGDPRFQQLIAAGATVTPSESGP